METDLKKMCQILEIREKQQFLFVLFPVCFVLAKPYPFPSNPFSLLACFPEENHQSTSSGPL